MKTNTVSRVGETITDTVQDVASQVVERAPEIASAVGRGARSTADAITDTVVTVAQKTPFVEAPRRRSVAPTLVKIGLLLAILGVASWLLLRRRSRADEGTMRESEDASESQEIRRITA